MGTRTDDQRAEGSGRGRARTIWDEYKWLILMAAVTLALGVLAVRGCAGDAYRQALMDETTRCIDESGVLDRAGLSKAEIRAGIEGDDAAEMYATMRELRCLGE